jgi:hypothetical protein
MQVQLARLFGSESHEAKARVRTSAQWKKTLRHVLDDLERYIDANVNTDEFHFFLLVTCILAGRESLKEENFFPGYAEAVSRLALLLMGDYPDHRRPKAGSKRADHYRLNRRRTLVYAQDQDQRLANLIAASRVPFLASVPDPYAELREWRTAYGSKVGYRHFLRWYRRRHPEIYSKVF